MTEVYGNTNPSSWICDFPMIWSSAKHQKVQNTCNCKYFGGLSGATERGRVRTDPLNVLSEAEGWGPQNLKVG